MDSGRSRFSTDAPKCPNCGHGLVQGEQYDKKRRKRGLLEELLDF